MDKYFFPNYLDEPKRVLLLTLDELAVCGVLVGVGFLLGHLFWGFPVAACAFFGMQKLKSGKPRGWLLCMAYWYLPPCGLLRGFPPSHLRSIWL